ncbi:MAG: hypothetical protein M3O34_12370 [Chloroflexota bacterium]|nr:hypothetical protein [Chloroflexota bacterium]
MANAYRSKRVPGRKTGGKDAEGIADRLRHGLLHRDDLNVHRAAAVRLFNLAHPRWEFVFQPRYAAYRTLIESWWKLLRSLALTGRRVESWEEVCRSVEAATAHWNAHRHLWVHPRSAGVVGEAGRQPPDEREVHGHGHPTRQVVLREALLGRELVELLRLERLPPQHRCPTSPAPPGELVLTDSGPSPSLLPEEFGNRSQHPPRSGHAHQYGKLILDAA